MCQVEHLNRVDDQHRFGGGSGPTSEGAGPSERSPSSEEGTRGPEHRTPFLQFDLKVGEETEGG